MASGSGGRRATGETDTTDETGETGARTEAAAVARPLKRHVLMNVHHSTTADSAHFGRLLCWRRLDVGDRRRDFPFFVHIYFEFIVMGDVLIQKHPMMIQKRIDDVARAKSRRVVESMSANCVRMCCRCV